MLCNISTGKITVSKDIEPLVPAGKRHSDTNDDFAMGSLSIGRASSTSLAMSRYSSSDASDTNTDNEFMNDVSNVQLKVSNLYNLLFNLFVTTGFVSYSFALW